MLYARLQRDEVIEQAAAAALDQGERILRHEFDLLGSGPLRNARGAAAPGIEGISYPACARPSIDPDGRWLRSVLNASNAVAGTRVWRLIGSGRFAHAGYEPIDWQLDYKSGWRWSERTHFDRIRIGPARGADIKMPWELSRMQHLPLLALGLRDPSVDVDLARRAHLVAELRAQILDFIASNPPRFGAAWASPMEVAIRAVNWIVALSFAAEAEVLLDEEAEIEVAASIEAHARHVLAHLEWSPEPRSNHYLAEIVGLIFMALHLPQTQQTDAWLGFAIRELGCEIDLQFREDGGNYEASTGYHRLSTEMALLGLAVVRGLSPERLDSVARAASQRLQVRPPQPGTPLALNQLADGSRLPFAATTLLRLERAAELVLDATRADGSAVMIGDNDSGTLVRIGFDDGPANCHLGVVAIAGALFGRSDLQEASRRMAAAGMLALGLSQGRTLPHGRDSFPSRSRRAEVSVAPMRRSKEAPEEARRCSVLPLPTEVLQSLVTAAYPEFGLYTFRNDRLFVSVRCFDPSLGGVWSHAHDDNLGLTVWFDGEDLVGDPGTYCYTSFPELRNLWRSAAAHAVPRQKGATVLSASSAFSATQRARGVCTGFGADGFSGRLMGQDWAVERRVEISADRITIIDTADPGPLEYPARDTKNVFMTKGYGRKTARPVPVL